MQILVKHLRWTEEELDHEASDRHRHALLEGLGLSEESKTVNSAAVKLEEIGQEEGTDTLEGTERKEFRSFSGDAQSTWAWTERACSTPRRRYRGVSCVGALRSQRPRTDCQHGSKNDKSSGSGVPRDRNPIIEGLQPLTVQG